MLSHQSAMKKSIPIRLLLVVSNFALLPFEISSVYGQPAQQPWIESGSDKGVLARHLKSPDGRYALAWVVVAGDQTTIDWELLKNAPDSFYEKYDLRELWVVDLAQNRKLCSLGTSIGYVRPGSHRSLSVAWGPLEGGRRFAIIGYEWKWGTEALILLDIGSDRCRETQIGQILDSGVGIYRFAQVIVKDLRWPRFQVIGFQTAQVVGFAKIGSMR